MVLEGAWSCNVLTFALPDASPLLLDPFHLKLSHSSYVLTSIYSFEALAYYVYDSARLLTIYSGFLKATYLAGTVCHLRIDRSLSTEVGYKMILVRQGVFSSTKR